MSGGVGGKYAKRTETKVYENNGTNNKREKMVMGSPLRVGTLYISARSAPSPPPSQPKYIITQDLQCYPSELATTERVKRWVTFILSL